MRFVNGKLVLPDGVREGLEVAVEDGRITDIRETGAADGDVVDLGGAYLAPGFIDLHVHGAMGRDTMEGTADAFRAICEYHATGGTTSLLLTTATAAMADIRGVLQSIHATRSSLPQIVGAHVEGPFISRAKPGAQRAEFIRDPEAAAVSELFGESDVMKRVTVAPELPGALEFIRAAAARGISVSGGHSDAWDEEARAGFESGMRSVTHTFNCMSSARRRGAQRVAGLLEFALSEPEISCELIADGLHVLPTLMRMLVRAKGASGICLVTDATAGAGLPSGTHFKLAGRDCVVDGGACWLADRSALAGSAARMVDLVRTMVEIVGVPLFEAIGMASANPARALGLSRKGRIAVGADADFVVLAPDLKVLATYLHGEKIFGS